MDFWSLGARNLHWTFGQLNFQLLTKCPVKLIPKILRVFRINCSVPTAAALSQFGCDINSPSGGGDRVSARSVRETRSIRAEEESANMACDTKFAQAAALKYQVSSWRTPEVLVSRGIDQAAEV